MRCIVTPCADVLAYFTFYIDYNTHARCYLTRKYRGSPRVAKTHPHYHHVISRLKNAVSPICRSNIKVHLKRVFALMDVSCGVW